MRLWCCWLAIAAAAAQTQTGEITSREEALTFRSSVSMVRVPVVVRDRAGHSVGGLTKDDFRLTDLGKAQEIAQFALQEGAAGKAGGNESLASPGGAPATESRPIPPGRYVLFVFDDLNLTEDQLGGVRAAAVKFVEQGIPAGERMAILTLSGNLSLEMTDDAASIREALAKIPPAVPPRHFPPASFYAASQFMRNTGDETAGCTAKPPCEVHCDPRIPPVLLTQTYITSDCLNLLCERMYEAPGIARATLLAVYAEGMAAGTRGFQVLNNAVRLLASMPGERVMVLISPGIFLPDELQRSLDESIDRATRAGVIINTLDARGVRTFIPTGKVEGCIRSSVQTAQQVARWDQAEDSARGLVLDTLAYSTGGEMVSDNDFLGGLNRLARPPEYVYYLGYYPKELRPDGKFHQIEVALADGRDLSVQTRKGYWAPSQTDDPAAAARRELADAVFSRDTLRDLPLDIDTAYYKTTAADARLKITSHLDISRLHLSKVEDRNRNDVTLVCALFDGNGNYLQGVKKIIELRLKDENLERHRSQGVTVDSVFEVKRGAYVVRVVARDAQGRQMAAADNTLEIP